MKRIIRWTIDLPMEFPDEWNDHDIEFHLNESSWCCSNILPILDEYDSKYGCICNISHAKVIDYEDK